jgi:solute carrier family 29 (equilibrative nucleoside transporter), member 1/2/3
MILGQCKIIKLVTLNEHFLILFINSLLMLTIYNIGDLIGKQISSIPFYTIHILYGVVLSRFLFIFTFFMTMNSSENGFFNNDVFAYFNMLTFAITNGFTTAGLMFLGPSRGKD